MDVAILDFRFWIAAAGAIVDSVSASIRRATIICFNSALRPPPLPNDPSAHGKVNYEDCLDHSESPGEIQLRPRVVFPSMRDDVVDDHECNAAHDGNDERHVVPMESKTRPIRWQCVTGGRLIGIVAHALIVPAATAPSNGVTPRQGYDFGSFHRARVPLRCTLGYRITPLRG
jgi:hypothetical protein